MANNYCQLYYHAVFAVKNRQSLIRPEFKQDVYNYISGIVTNQGHKLLLMNGMPDHVHLLLSCRTTLRMDNLIGEIKEHSNKYINQNFIQRGKFYWQGGYGIFTVSANQLDRIFAYIRNQETHHAKQKFIPEYKQLLKEEGLQFDDKYIFQDPYDHD